MYYVTVWNAYVGFREDKGKQIALFISWFILSTFLQYVRTH